MIRQFWLQMSRLERGLAVTALALFAGILHWACLARITHDEGYMLDVIAHFPLKHVMQVVYNGRWGTRWVVTIGPTVSLPLGLLAYLGDVHVVVTRLAVYAAFVALFFHAGKLVGLSWRARLVSAAVFLLWTLTMVWRPDINGSSINLVATVFGEGIAFAFALLANVLAARKEKSLRRWAWVCAALAVGAKSVALLAVAVPLGYVTWQSVRKRSPRWAGLDGLAVALAIVAGWQLWNLSVLGWDDYLGDWYGLWFWLGHGGGYHATGGLLTFSRKIAQLTESNVDPLVVLAVVLLGAGFLAWMRWRRRADGELIPETCLRLVAASTGLFFFWWLFFAGRGWMRHLWIGFALLGWLASVYCARLLEKRTDRWSPVGAFGFALLLVATHEHFGDGWFLLALGLGLMIYALTLIWRERTKRWSTVAGFCAGLFAIALFQGSLPALGPLGPTERWQAQRALAEELAAKFPFARLMVSDWHMVPHLAFFMKRPQFNLLEVQPSPGDLVVCDTESACDESLLKYCEPAMTEARIAWCVVPLPVGKK